MGFSLHYFRTAVIINKYVQEHRGEFFFINQEHVKKLQACYLGMLQDLCNIFEREGIKVCLGGGTLLGKMRHDGFIPWDDDVDISVTREDYNKLMSIFKNNKWNICEKYDFRGPGFCKGAEVRIAKIYKKDSTFESAFPKKNAMNKIFIDICIIENVPNNRLLKYIKGMQTIIIICIIGCVETKMNGINYNLGWKWNVIYYMKYLIGTFFSIISLQDWYDKLYGAAAYERVSEYCTFPFGLLLYFREAVRRDIIFPLKKTDFYGIPVWIPNKAEVYLEKRYGDWKKIPPENKREYHYCKRIDFGKDFI